METAVLEGSAFSECTQQYGDELGQFVSMSKCLAAFPITKSLSIFGTF